METPAISSTVLAYAEAQARATTEDVTDMAERVDAVGQVGWLIDSLWPADAYGVIAAKDKAGKTWVATDLAVSVATGTPWLGRFGVEQGTVIMYAGEGGARNIVRRVRAIAAHKDRPFGTLRGHLHVSEIAPRLKEEKALETLNIEVGLHGPRLVIVDPLYLAAAGGKGSDLYAMGELLMGAQHICQNNGAALVVTHHWNKTGTGTGVDRMTGVGPTAWGRVLGSGSVESARTEDGRSIVRVEWEFVGSEIPGTEFTMTRTVWAEDPSNLSSPLHYEVEVLDGLASVVQDIEDDNRLEAWLRENPSQPMRAVEREFGTGVRRRLTRLKEQGRATFVVGPNRSKLWSAS